MIDSRQGPLPVWADPYSTAAERCVAGVLDPFHPSAGPYLKPGDPHLLAYRGYVPSPGWGRHYYRDGEVWRDTETDAARDAPAIGGE